MVLGFVDKGELRDLLNYLRLDSGKVDDILSLSEQSSNANNRITWPVFLQYMERVHKDKLQLPTLWQNESVQ